MQRTLRRCTPLLVLPAWRRAICTSVDSNNNNNLHYYHHRSNSSIIIVVGRKNIGSSALREYRRFASSMITKRRSRSKTARVETARVNAETTRRQTQQKEEEKEKEKKEQQQKQKQQNDDVGVIHRKEETVVKAAAAAMVAEADLIQQKYMNSNPVYTSNSSSSNSNSNNNSNSSNNNNNSNETLSPVTTTEGSEVNTAAAEIGTLLDLENPLNLRLATLMQQPGKAVRAIAVTYSTKRDFNFEIDFTDIASGVTLQCRLDKVRTVYMSWVRQFHAAWVVLFVPTLASANSTLLENAILFSGIGRSGVTTTTTTTTTSSSTAGSLQAAMGGKKEMEEPDHIILSYTKMREVLCKVKRDEQVNSELLSNAVLNAYPDDWKNFIHSPNSCSPMAVVTSAFDFRPTPGQSPLNKSLLHAQLSSAAAALQPPGKRSASSSSSSRTHAVHTNSNTTNTTTGGGNTKKESWMLVFVSAPLASASSNASSAAVPPMQDLLTGEFVEPLLLGERNVIYIIGTGTAAECFAQFPLVRKGKQKVSILLQDIENQLGLRRQNRPTLTTTLAQALDLFSRYTWIGLMQPEDGALRVPRAPNTFAMLHRRSVTCEIVPNFLESLVPKAHHISMSGVSGMMNVDGRGNMGGGGGAAGAMAHGKVNRRLDEHIKAIFNNNERLEREKEWRTKLRNCDCFFVEVKSANVTAARRADNPFSARNGIVEFHGQLWPSLDGEGAKKSPPVETLTAKLSANGDVKSFVDPKRCIPDALPTGSENELLGKKHKPQPLASGGIIIAWDVKRVLLFLRDSEKLREFLYNGGRIWCAQYAQYLLRGFNHDNLSTMERTLLQYNMGQGKLHSLEKLKMIFEKQLDIAVNTRQLISVLHRMDGLLAATEMEIRGLQLANQTEVTKFSQQLKTSHEKLEKLVNDKIMEFTTSMDDEVRKRINFRSPQDISTIIYGGALCRHLSSRYLSPQQAKTPVTAILPHAVCRVTGTPIPDAYTQPDTLLGLTGTNSGGSVSHNKRMASGLTGASLRSALSAIEKITARNTMDNLLNCTAVVVVTCKVRPGNFLESFCLYCPSSDSEEELRYNVAIDDVVPVTDEPELLTVMQLKEKIANYKPLRALQPLKKHGKKSYDLRNLLILTNCAHDKLTALVETGIVQTMSETVLGRHNDEGGVLGLERVCFCDIHRAFPPPGQGSDSFENDFMGLVDVAEHAGLSARANWEAAAREFIPPNTPNNSNSNNNSNNSNSNNNTDKNSNKGGAGGGGGSDGVTKAIKALISHCAALAGTARDPFRSTQPLPCALNTGKCNTHPQERASTRGLLWIVTPARLHPLLYRCLRGRNASSGADAIERITVLLSAERQIDLSFFKALQQLRFTEKKMQLFEEGALFRAVLPECSDRVHGELCHVVTATGRLSSQSPNLQNIPKEEDLRRLIVSRFGSGTGRMIEADYSQLEVVVLAALSRDTRMLQELRDKIDFHCLRVALMTKEPYEDVVRKAKREKDPHYIQLRQQAKTFSFQRQYGAGISTIATTTGLTEQEVERLIAAEEQHYKELGRYYRLVTDCVEAGADRLLRLRTLDAPTWAPAMRRMILLTEPMRYFVVPTGSKFDFTKDRKSVPRLKNYPVQGLAGEIVQIMCGKIIRRFYERNNYDNKAFLVNTVHDCVWIDAHASVANEVMHDVSTIMSSTSEVIGSLWPDMKLDVPFNADVHIGPSLGELSR